MPTLDYTAPPTCAAFSKSNSFGRIIAGPVGSGKTTACVVELLRRAAEQSPGENGIRYTRFAIVRQTLQQLKATVLKDCETWLAGFGVWKVSESTFHLRWGDVASEWVFIPLEKAEDQARLLSMQLTGAWLSECIEMNIDTVGPISGRMPRYPYGKRGNPTWFGMIADTNFPTELTPWHKFMEEPPPNWQVFKQPSGLSFEAENLNFLGQTDQTSKLPIDHPTRLAQGRTYYTRYVEMYGEESEWVRRYVMAQYGDDPSGAAVFKNSFRTHFHVVDSTQVIPGYPLLVGQDFGRNPWSLLCQVDHMGRLLVHEEVKATNIGLEKHVQESLRPRLFQEKYLGLRIAVVGDPAGIAKGSIAEESCFDALKRFGFSAFPAPSNNIEPRLRAVEALLGRHVNGGPALLINRTGCPWLVRAMSGGYRFTKTPQGALRAIPEKNDPEGFSHVADDLQYVALVVHGGLVNDFARRLNPPKRRDPRLAITAASWT